MTFDPGNRLIAAIDVPDRQAADGMVKALHGAASWLKIGLELFTACGPDLIRDYVAQGNRIMLDLKMHDISATVGRAVARAADLGVELLTIHTAGGAAMMEAAAAAAGGRVALLGVTVLTSLDLSDLVAVGVSASDVEELVVKRAKLAVSAGCAGVVSSPREAARLRAELGAGPLIVTPGIRPTGTASGDQKRIMTPRLAREAGADLIVVGRPLRDAPDPAAAARAIVAELEG